ncbi:MAG: MiaB/RimO family radical SAM methylthiotransferase [Candidatus Paceibacterota bacterium]|jgi:tRNA-2-methylthio-N6-dimethylallyladenosine synthase
MKYYIKTYGCQMNKSDSERISALLESAHMEKASEESEADLVVLNICSVRQTAIDRIFGNMKKYNKIKKHKPDFKTVITGCVLEKDKNKFKGMFDLVIDIKEIDRIFERLGIAIDKDRLSGMESYFNIDSKHQSKITAYVPIMTGCNNFCSYCVVPYTRGREYSRPVEEIISEISALVEKGFKEIILLGQNVNSYCGKVESPLPAGRQGKSKVESGNFIIEEIEQCDDETIDFPALLRMINNIPGDFWIRFLTSHPKDITEELIRTVSKCDKCTEYMHLALQSGDDDILSKMNRKYTAKHFLALTDLIRIYMPGAAITTDVIIGFPGETKKQFMRTADVMKKARFDMVYINKYSPREGTASAKLPNDVPLEEKKRREKVLTKILEKTALANNKRYIGKTIDVLVEKVDDKYIYGRSRTFKNVRISLACPPEMEQSAEEYHNSFKMLCGNFISIKIAIADSWGLEGKLTS